MEIDAVINRACTITVVGETWLPHDLKNLDNTSLVKKQLHLEMVIKHINKKEQLIVPAQVDTRTCFSET